MSTRQSLFAVLQDAKAGKLRAVDKLVLLYLTWRQGSNGECWPSLRTIGADLRLDRGNCLRAIRRLCVAGCIRKVSGRGGRGHPNHYEAVADKGMPDDTLSTDEKGCAVIPFEARKGCPVIPERDVQCNQKEQLSNQKSAALRKRPPFVPPGVDDVRAYADGRGDPDFNAERFVTWYAERGWQHKNGKPMRDWKRTVGTWMDRNDQQRIERGEPPHDGYSQYGCHPATEEDIERLTKLGVFAP